MKFYELTIVAGIVAIPIIYILSMLNGVDPFSCPAGTKTVSSPTSFQKWCIEE